MQAPTRKQLDGARGDRRTTTSGAPAAARRDRRHARLRADRHERPRRAAPRASPPGPRSRRRSRDTTPRASARSQTLHERLLYVAVPIASGGVVHGAVRITYPMSTVDARIRHYWLILGAIGAVVLARRRGRRHRPRALRHAAAARLEEAAAAVGDGRLDARAPEREGPPEVRSLAAVFNETVVKLGQLLRSQEEFVADASHELRTPLTALRLRLESLGRLDGARPRRGAARGGAALASSSKGCSRSPAPTPARAGGARRRGRARARSGLDAWRPLADERRRRARRPRPTAPLPVRAAPDGSRRCSTTCRERARRGAGGADGHAFRRRRRALGRAARARQGPG